MFFTLLFVISSSMTSIQALDAQFRFKDGFCQRNGQYGMNPAYWGECGNYASSQVKNSRYYGDNLKGINFTSLYAFNLSFENVTLAYATVQGAFIFQSQFKNLKGPSMDLSSSHLKGVQFIESDLSHLRATGARFNKVSFHKTNLQKSSLWGSLLKEVDFSDSDLRGANLEATYVLLCQFKGAKFDEKTRLPFSKQSALQRGMTFVE